MKCSLQVGAVVRFSALHNIAYGQRIIYLPGPILFNTEQYKTPVENINALEVLKQRLWGPN
jgi:hypothetical protein